MAVSRRSTKTDSPAPLAKCSVKTDMDVRCFAKDCTNSLPNNIHFILDNGVDFGIYAEEMEYYYIELKEL